MGCRIIHSNGGQAVLYCSTTDWAFGPVFFDTDDHDAEERADAFCEWLAPTDPRTLADDVLEREFSRFLREEKEYWKKRELAELGEE